MIGFGFSILRILLFAILSLLSESLLELHLLMIISQASFREQKDREEKRVGTSSQVSQKISSMLLPGWQERELGVGTDNHSYSFFCWQLWVQVKSARPGVISGERQTERGKWEGIPDPRGLLSPFRFPCPREIWWAQCTVVPLRTLPPPFSPPWHLWVTMTLCERFLIHTIHYSCLWDLPITHTHARTSQRLCQHISLLTCKPWSPSLPDVLEFAAHPKIHRTELIFPNVSWKATACREMKYKCINFRCCGIMLSLHEVVHARMWHHGLVTQSLCLVCQTETIQRV